MDEQLVLEITDAVMASRSVGGLRHATRETLTEGDLRTDVASVVRDVLALLSGQKVPG